MYLWLHSEYKASSELAGLRTDKFEQIFLDPEHRSPVAVSLGHSLVELAKATSQQLLADETVQIAEALPVTIALGKQLDLNPLFDFLVGQAHAQSRVAEFTQSDGWLTLKPYDLEDAATFEVSREKLGSYLRGIKSTGIREFRPLTEFAAASGCNWDQFANRWLGPGRRVLFPSSDPLADEFESYAYVRFVGLLTTEQLDLAEGRGLPLSLCPSKALAEAQVDSLYPAEDGRKTADLAREPTVAMPHGLPGEGILRIKHSDEALLRASATVPAPPPAEANMSTLSRHFRDAVASGRIRFSDNWQDKETYKLISVRAVRRRTYDFTFTFPGNVVCKPIPLIVGDYDGAPVSSVDEVANRLPECNPKSTRRPIRRTPLTHIASSLALRPPSRMRYPFRVRSRAMFAVDWSAPKPGTLH